MKRKTFFSHTAWSTLYGFLSVWRGGGGGGVEEEFAGRTLVQNSDVLLPSAIT